MVNTRYNGVRPVAPINEPVEESATSGHKRGSGRGRESGRGRGRLRPTRGGAPVENVPRKEAPPAPQEEVEENVEIEDEEDVRQEKGASAGNTDITPLDTMLAKHIMTFLKGLVGPSVFPTVQAA
ncbi:hypothetical protein RDI58_029102 [Solanum bulbocastanum]|uniref:Uncharacterized protein n=1 Tax=Solanum bulbocastanum TaxID=147425 RepID=A0AAN8Y1S9_SOLBU